jgi:hypothetical protein
MDNDDINNFIANFQINLDENTIIITNWEKIFLNFTENSKKEIIKLTENIFQFKSDNYFFSFKTKNKDEKLKWKKNLKKIIFENFLKQNLILNIDNDNNIQIDNDKKGFKEKKKKDKKEFFQFSNLPFCIKNYFILILQNAIFGFCERKSFKRLKKLKKLKNESLIIDSSLIKNIIEFDNKILKRSNLKLKIKKNN